MSARKDTDYLSVSSRVRAMETRLLTRERLERMIDAADDAQALKVLAECGCGEISDPSPDALEAALRAHLARTEGELASILPDRTLPDFFGLETDYHNLKVLLKAARAGRPAEPLLLPGGRYAPDRLAADREKGLTGGEYALAFRDAAARASAVLEGTGDARQADLILDEAWAGELTALAASSGVPLLRDLAALWIDTANLRTLVRCARLDRDAAFLAAALLPGGSVSREELARMGCADGIARFRSGPLAAAAEQAAALARPDGPPLTAFERACDDAKMEYLSRCRRVPFGPEVVIGYLFALRAGQTAARVVMAGRRAGLEPDVIRQRLRACYV